MTKDQLLKIALEDLEGIHPGNMTPMAEEYWNKAITAIKQALAAPQQEPVAFNRKTVWNVLFEVWNQNISANEGLQKLQDLYTTAQQEPIAWMCSDESLVSKGYSRFSRTCEGEWNIPVYTKPQAPQAAPTREWTGLTMQEAYDCYLKGGDRFVFAAAIESLLKEKNT